MSFRSSARNRVGNLSNFKSSAPPVQHDDTDDDDDDNYDSEEEEERLLSRRHGEAQEDPKESSNNNKESDKKRKPTDEEIAAEYNKSENAKKKQRVSRRQQNITEMDLVQPNGLATIYTTFPHLFRKQNYQTNRRSDMAKFSRQLINAYQQWSNAIVPTTPLEEVAWRIQTMNSKTSVKRFLQTMRDKVRNEHVERLCGLEKAEQMIAQLDMELSVQQDYDHHDDDNGGLDNQNGAAPEEQDVSPTTTTASPEEGEEGPSVSIPPMNETDPTNSRATTTNNNSNTTTDDNAGMEARNTITPMPAVRKEHRRHVLDDSSDEEELTFDDFDDDAPRLTAPSMRRPVLEESDDDDDKNPKDDETNKVRPASFEEGESPRKEDTRNADEEKEPDQMGLAQDDTLDTIKPSINTALDDEDDDEEAEFEFDTQPVHPKISEKIDESPTVQDISAETMQTGSSEKVPLSQLESGVDQNS